MESTIVDDVAENSADSAPSPEARTIALNKAAVIAGLIGATALSALDNTIVVTVMPTIVGVLGGLPLYPLIIAVYSLTSTTTMPLYGKLSDMYGRKPIFMAGTGLFILGSALCGLAWDMPSLIFFRGVQGLGAAAVIPVSLTLVGDIFGIEERARMNGVFSSVWGISSVAGPLIGGTIVQFVNWRWVFFINVPVGIASALLLFLYLREPSIHARQKIDVAGAVTLTLGVALLLVGLQVGGRSNWLAPAVFASVGMAIALLLIFGWVERRAAAPILSLGLLMRPIIAVSSLVGVLAGAVLIGILAYVPLLVQGVWGGSATEAGLMVAPLSLGWPVASATSGRLLRRFSYRTLAVGGTFIILAGSLLLLLIALPPIATNPWLRVILIAVSTFTCGAGFGFSTTAMLIAVQNSVPWSERGIATASVQFFRNMGNTVGAAILGAVLTATLAAALAVPAVQNAISQLSGTGNQSGSDSTLGPVNVLFEPAARKTLGSTALDALSSALSNSLNWVYLGIAILAALSIACVLRFPRTEGPAIRRDE